MKRSNARLILLAVLPLALHPVTLPIAAGGGRAPQRCLQVCHAVLVACDDRSSAICLEAFGESEEKYAACRLSGKTVCLDLERDCRFSCLSYREGQMIEP